MRNKTHLELDRFWGHQQASQRLPLWNERQARRSPRARRQANWQKNSGGMIYARAAWDAAFKRCCPRPAAMTAHFVTITFREWGIWGAGSPAPQSGRGGRKDFYRAV